jgi:hypothetical protein
MAHKWPKVGIANDIFKSGIVLDGKFSDMVWTSGNNAGVAESIHIASTISPAHIPGRTTIILVLTSARFSMCDWSLKHFAKCMRTRGKG